MELVRSVLHFITGQRMHYCNLNYTLRDGDSAVYLGYTKSRQPSAEEIQQSYDALVTLKNRDLIKCDKKCKFCLTGDKIKVLSKTRQSLIYVFELSRVVLSCVDAKNQNVLAVFYHSSDSRCNSVLECHLFQCSTRQTAKGLAMNIGTALISSYKRRKQSNTDEPEIRTLARYVTYGEVYEGQQHGRSSSLITTSRKSGSPHNSRTEIDVASNESLLWWDDSCTQCAPRLPSLPLFVKVIGYVTLLIVCGVGLVLMLSAKQLKTER